MEVETAVPAFIGYTEKALRGTKPLWNEPTKITSFAEYLLYFGAQPPTKVTLQPDGDIVRDADRSTQFFLYASLRLYFDNGDGPCFIVAVGSYTDAITNGKSANALSQKPLEALRKEMEPTMIVVPDAVLLEAATDNRDVQQQVLQHCHDMQSRIGIFDIFGGGQARSNDEQDVHLGHQRLSHPRQRFLQLRRGLLPVAQH